MWIPANVLSPLFFCLASRGLCRSPAEDVNTKHNNLSHHGEFANSSSSTQKRTKEFTTLASQPSIWTFWTEQITFFILTHSLIFLSFSPLFFLPPLLLHPQWHLGFSSVYVMWAGVIRTTAEEFINSACERRTTTCVRRLRWTQFEQMKAFFPCCWMNEIFHIFSSSKKNEELCCWEPEWGIKSLMGLQHYILEPPTQWGRPSTARQWECEKRRDDWGSPCRQSSGGITSATVNFRKGKLNET